MTLEGDEEPTTERSGHGGHLAALLVWLAVVTMSAAAAAMLGYLATAPGLPGRWCEAGSGYAVCAQQWLGTAGAAAAFATAFLAWRALEAGSTNLRYLRDQVDESKRQSAAAERSATSQTNERYIAQLDGFCDDLKKLYAELLRVSQIPKAFWDGIAQMQPAGSGKEHLQWEALGQALERVGNKNSPRGLSFDALVPLYLERKRVDDALAAFREVRDMADIGDPDFIAAKDAAIESIFRANQVAFALTILLTSGESVTALVRLNGDGLIEDSNRLVDPQDG